MLRHTEDTAPEPRFDAASLRQVTDLAQRLQQRDGEELSAAQVEAIAAEVGIQPRFVREAMAEVRRRSARVARAVSPQQREFRALATAWSGAFGWGALAFALSIWGFGGGAEWSATLPQWLAAVASLGIPLPLAAVLGFLAGKRTAGAFVGVATMLAAVPGVLMTMISFGGSEFSSFVMPWVFGGGPLAATLGYQAGKLREHYFPSREATPAPPETRSRGELVRALFALQDELQGGKVRRAFVSIDVVDSTEMKRDEEELAVEFSFAEFREWAEQVLIEHGGEGWGGVGDGIMCAFENERGALRAAKRLQQGLAAFNHSHNRLRSPFRLRIGVSLGYVPLSDRSREETQSLVIDRAAALRKAANPGEIALAKELASDGILELGAIEPLGAEVLGEPGFVWRGAEAGERPRLSLDLDE